MFQYLLFFPYFNKSVGKLVESLFPHSRLAFFLPELVSLYLQLGFSSLGARMLNFGSETVPAAQRVGCSMQLDNTAAHPSLLPIRFIRVVSSVPGQVLMIHPNSHKTR